MVEYWSPKPWVVGSSPSAPAKGRGMECKWHSVPFFTCSGGLEGEAVQSELPVDVRDRRRPSAQFARESSPSAPARNRSQLASVLFFCEEHPLRGENTTTIQKAEMQRSLAPQITALNFIQRVKKGSDKGQIGAKLVQR